MIQRHRRGFTLMELLVVIAIIGVLFGMLMPALSRVRESARQANCLTKVKQIAVSIRQYAQDNNGYLPAPAQGAPGRVSMRDWFQWQAPQGSGPKAITRDPERGGAIKYMPQSKSSFAGLICPSDEVEFHTAEAGSGPFRYSYAMNVFMSNPRAHIEDRAANRSPTSQGGGLMDPAMVFNLKLVKINNPARKILVIEEDERTIDDGAWAATPIDPDFPVPGNLASRHERRKNTTDPERRGNVGFVDGHADYVNRRFATDPENLSPLK